MFAFAKGAKIEDESCLVITTEQHRQQLAGLLRQLLKDGLLSSSYM